MAILVDVRCDECLKLASDDDGQLFFSVETAKIYRMRQGWHFPKPSGRGRVRCPECLADDNLVAERDESLTGGAGIGSAVNSRPVNGSTPALCRDVLHGIGPGPTYLCELPMGHELPHRSRLTTWAPLEIDADYEAGVPAVNELPIVPPYAGA